MSASPYRESGGQRATDNLNSSMTGHQNIMASLWKAEPINRPRYVERSGEMDVWVEEGGAGARVVWGSHGRPDSPVGSPCQPTHDLFLQWPSTPPLLTMNRGPMAVTIPPTVLRIDVCHQRKYHYTPSGLYSIAWVCRDGIVNFRPADWLDCHTYHATFAISISPTSFALQQTRVSRCTHQAGEHGESRVTTSIARYIRLLWLIASPIPLTARQISEESSLAAYQGWFAHYQKVTSAWPYPLFSPH